MDTPPDQALMDITKLVASIFRVPVCGVALVDESRVWYKAHYGSATEQPRRLSFCGWQFLPDAPEVLMVPDATQDPRFANNPIVRRKPFVRFYAGAALTCSSGHRIGALSIVDRQPRTLDEEGCRLLVNLAGMAMRELENASLVRWDCQAAEGLWWWGARPVRTVGRISET
eukprot:jgi/Astpho2/8883/e_gw1.00129.82.1_t